MAPRVAACGDEAVKAVIVATPANTMPARAKRPSVPNDFDFKVLYDIVIPPSRATGLLRPRIEARAGGRLTALR
jgi:hypothetical protein